MSCTRTRNASRDVFVCGLSADTCGLHRDRLRHLRLRLNALMFERPTQVDLDRGQRQYARGTEKTAAALPETTGDIAGGTQTLQLEADDQQTFDALRFRLGAQLVSSKETEQEDVDALLHQLNVIVPTGNAGHSTFRGPREKRSPARATLLAATILTFASSVFGHDSGIFVAGQTWTAFMNASAIPDNLDFVSTAGTTFVRQPLTRWTQHFTDGWNLMIGAEQPETALTAFAGEYLTPGDDRFPDIVLTIQFKGDFGNMQRSLLGRQLRIDEEALDADALAGGVGPSGHINTGDLLVSPILRTEFAIEYIFARRELEDGAAGDLHRGQTSCKFVS